MEKMIKVVIIATSGFQITMEFPKDEKKVLINQVIDELIDFRNSSGSNEK